MSSAPGTSVPARVESGLRVKTAAAYRIAEQGSLLSTDNSLDVAIQGKGYFQIQLPDGEIAYTRDGSVQLSPNGQIVNHNGYTVVGAGTIPTDATNISINAQGQVFYQQQGVTNPAQAGQFQTA